MMVTTKPIQANTTTTKSVPPPSSTAVQQQPPPPPPPVQVLVVADDDEEQSSADEDAAAITTKKYKEQERRLRLLDSISNAQRQYLRMPKEPRVVFGNLLENLLELTDSEYGFIGEVKVDPKARTKYLQTHAITNIAWDSTTHAFYEDNVESGLKFYNLKSLFGHVIVEETPVISNHPTASHPSACGIPEGHPPLNHFLGIPFFECDVTGANAIMNGMVGIANKPGGYSQADIDFLEPLTVT